MKNSKFIKVKRCGVFRSNRAIKSYEFLTLDLYGRMCPVRVRAVTARWPSRMPLNLDYISIMLES